MGYIFSDEWHRERDRLAGIEAALDPGTTRFLEQIGVGAGWRCAEVGAGGGSIAAWFAKRVGPSGSVLATDLDTRYLDALDAPNLQVLRHDLTEGMPEGDRFDAVHARLVVEHVSDRPGAIDQLITWLRPGGWLIVEDIDWTGMSPITGAPAFEIALDRALQAATAAVGYDRAFGSQLPALFLRSPLSDVAAEQRKIMIRGSTPEAEAFKLTLERIAPIAVAGGLLTDDQVATALALCADPAFATMSAPMCSAWGRVRGTA
jgi:SAM-dependent methyltransferase